MDFHSPNKPTGGIQDWYNSKGLTCNQGHKKLEFYVL